MKKILRLYIGPDCIKDEAKIIDKILAVTESIDLDYALKSGKVKMGSSQELAGEKVLIGDQEVEVPFH